MTMDTLTVNDSITAASVISGLSIVATNIYGSNITTKPLSSSLQAEL
jgi:hypothetical protein